MAKSKRKKQDMADLARRSNATRIARHFRAEVKFDRGGRLPFRARRSDAGFDIYAAETVVIFPGKSALIHTGLRLNTPDGYWYSLMGRSSFNKAGVFIPTNVIDAGYTGEIMVCLLNLSVDDFVVTEGDRIAQIVFLPILHPDFEEVTEFSLGAHHRGTAGFGSSGK